MREFKAYAAGRMQEHRTSMQMAMWSAWHTAQLTRAKRLPSLVSLLRKIGRRPGVPKTPAQLLEIAKMITAQMQPGRK